MSHHYLFDRFYPKKQHSLQHTNLHQTHNSSSLQRTKDLGLEVRPDAGNESGKGLFATKAFAEDDVVLEEPPLVSIQHAVTYNYTLACARCFKLVGSIEHQLANALHHLECRPGKFSGKLCEQGEEKPIQLPCSDQFPLPAIVACKGGCTSAVYCSEECRDAAWTAHHSLLCPSSSGSDDSKRYLDAFYEHAEATNDVFLLAAQSVATVLLEAQRQLESQTTAWGALQAAWEPFSMGQKALWWDSVARPSDILTDEAESQFRCDLKEMAEDALTLLKEALQHSAPDLCSQHPAILHLDVWGSLIGMFELNNLTLLVASPVPLWAQVVDDAAVEGLITPEEKAAADENETVAGYGGLDGIMEGEGEWVLLGNGFYPLQGCINHSCLPNAHAFKREQDISGDAVILATRDISPGEEIKISYIEQEGDWEERAEELRDYGFVCHCEKCEAEKLADELFSKTTL